MENVLAKKVLKYWTLYKDYLHDNNLSDDTDSITVEALINFVDSEILPSLNEDVDFDY